VNVTLPLTLDVTKGTVHKVQVNGGGTINAGAAGNAAQEMTVLIVNTNPATSVITLGNFFKAAGTVSLPTGQSALVRFVSDGSNWYELYRTVGL
jgi:hypothetical protein